MTDREQTRRDAEMSEEEARELSLDRVLGKVTGPWSDAETKYHARQFIAKNQKDNLVRLLAERYLALLAELEQAERELRQAGNEIDGERERAGTWENRAITAEARLAKVPALVDFHAAVRQLVKHEYRLKDHEAAFVLRTIEQALDDPALAVWEQE